MFLKSLLNLSCSVELETPYVDTILLYFSCLQNVENINIFLDLSES
jgi:hypothetical protein